jgi:hypothetical protein
MRGERGTHCQPKTGECVFAIELARLHARERHTLSSCALFAHGSCIIVQGSSGVIAVSKLTILKKRGITTKPQGSREDIQLMIYCMDVHVFIPKRVDSVQ